MPYRVTCSNPSCSKSATVPDAALGKNVRCRDCGTLVTVGGATRAIGDGAPLQSASQGDSDPARRNDSGRSGSVPPKTPSGRSRPQSINPPPDPVQTADLSTDPQQTADHTPRSHGARAELEADAPPAPPGYELLGRLGKGGMGVVYEARQTALNRIVALKMLLGGPLADDGQVARFLAEAEAAAAVKHPHVVQVFDFGAANGRPYLAMELLTGGLDRRLRDEGPQAPVEAAELVARLSAAVQAAHDLGIVHRDLKPANVLFDAEGVPKVTDFGLAKRGGRADLTATQAVMGTPAYMAPEQACGGTKFVGPAADVYALGVILYECLTGTRPFDDRDPLALLQKVAEDPPPPLRTRHPSVPRDLELICLKCLEKAPADRYPTAVALAEDLRRFVAGEPVTVRPAGRLERAAKWARRKPTLAAAYALGTAVTVLAVLVVGAGWLWRQAESARADAETEWAGAVTARDTAERAKGEEAAARQLAEINRRAAEDRKAKAETARRALQRVGALRDVETAERERADGNPTRARELLSAVPADLRGWEWNCAWRRSSPNRYTIQGAATARFTADGKWVVAIDAVSRGVRFWDAATGTPGRPGWVPAELTDPPAGRSVWLTDDGLWFGATGSGPTCLWDTETGLKREIGNWSPAAVSRDGGVLVAWVRSSGELQVVEVGTGKATSLRPNTRHSTVGSLWVRLSPEGSRLLTLVDEYELPTGLKDGARIGTKSFLSAWSLPSGERTVRLEVPQRGQSIFRAVAVSPDFGAIVFPGGIPAPDAPTPGKESAGKDPPGKEAKGPIESRWGLVRLDMTGKPTRFAPADTVDAIAWAPTGTFVVTLERTTGKRETFAVIRDPQTLEARARWPIDDTGILVHIAVSPDGRSVLCADLRGACRVWDVPAPTAAATKSYANSFSRDGSVRLDNEPDPANLLGRFVVSRGDGPRIPLDIGRRGPDQLSTLVAPDGSRVVSHFFDFDKKERVLITWDAATGKVAGRATGFANDLALQGFTADGGSVVLAGKSGARTYAVATLKEVTTPGSEFLSDMISRVCYPCRTVAGGVQVLGADGAPLGPPVPTGRCLGCAPELGLILLEREGAAELWSLTKGARLQAFRGRGFTGPTAFSPDRALVAVGTRDGVVVWDIATGQEALVLPEAVGVAALLHRFLEFTPDGFLRFNGGSAPVGVEWDGRPPGAPDRPALKPAAPVVTDPDILRLEKQLAEKGYDWGVHNELRHRYGAYDWTKSHYHCDQIFRRNPLDSYTLNCLAPELQQPKPDDFRVRLALLRAAARYPDFAALGASCRLKSAELTPDPAERKALLLLVIKAGVDGLDGHRKLARERLAALK